MVLHERSHADSKCDRAGRSSGGRGAIALGLRGIATSIPSNRLLALDEALDRLAEAEPQKAELVKLRFFAGLTLEQAADAIGVSRATATRHWTYARAWLYDAVSQSPESH